VEFIRVNPAALQILKRCVEPLGPVSSHSASSNLSRTFPGSDLTSVDDGSLGQALPVEAVGSVRRLMYPDPPSGSYFFAPRDHVRNFIHVSRKLIASVCLNS